MTNGIAQFIDVGVGAARRRIAYLRQEAHTDTQRPGLVWLQGFKSDMISTKAAALAEWATAQGLAMLRFDYSGHGQSGGRFEDGTIGRWVEEAKALFERQTAGPQIVIGSSMGGYLSLLLLRGLLAESLPKAARIKSLVLIAPAWDMTEELMWKAFPPDVRRQVMDEGMWLRPSLYGDPYPITRALIEDGRQHLIGRQLWDPGRPVTIIHGRLDPDVPLAHSQTLIGNLDGDWARLIEVADGEHRLSRPEDIELLLRVIGETGRA